ncbi:thiolase family protein [Parachlamydia acanthamoebae]|jgi:acetyl-CoA acyltransferase|uniref:thiolase family protein n=1 Tax=Parachlamydia acanthamoebae TaxID=83552 RepID=UPI0024E21725|nr:thiolase family protein [Parachlamydia acanthamoebae]
MKERLAIIEGIRTPFCKANEVLRHLEADDLGAFAVRELLARMPIPKDKIDELIFGNVIEPPHAGNVARVVAVKAGLSVKTPAYTVNRNCASGMEAVVTAANKIEAGEASIIITGGTESMSHFPVLFPNRMREFLLTFNKAKTWKQRLRTLLSFRPSLLTPQMPKLADPLCSLSMGQTAEILVRQFKITREEQDAFALMSQQRALAAREKLAEEIIPIPYPPFFDRMQLVDDGPREGTSLEGLAKLKPAFDSLTGTVTAGNSSQITDGAVALLVMSESKAKELGLQPIGYLVEYAYAGLDPSRMGLGPAYSIAKLLKKTGKKLQDFDLIEINEAFAGQVIAVERALNSPEFVKKELGEETVIGEIDRNKLNVNGGAIALGHPLGASGARLILTLLKELKRRKKNSGLAALCIGGGQGEAVSLEVQ